VWPKKLGEDVVKSATKESSQSLGGKDRGKLRPDRENEGKGGAKEIRSSQGKPTPKEKYIVYSFH